MWLLQNPHDNASCENPTQNWAYAAPNLDNIISEDNVLLSGGREDWGASRTPLPEIGFMLGSATAR